MKLINFSFVPSYIKAFGGLGLGVFIVLNFLAFVALSRDIWKRDISRNQKVFWIFVVTFIPWLGLLAYVYDRQKGFGLDF